MLELRVTNDKDRGQISEDRNQKTEVSGQRTQRKESQRSVRSRESMKTRDRGACFFSTNFE